MLLISYIFFLLLTSAFAKCGLDFSNVARTLWETSVAALKQGAGKALQSFDKHVAKALQFFEMRVRFRFQNKPRAVADADLTRNFFGFNDDEGCDLFNLKIQYKAYVRFHNALTPETPFGKCPTSSSSFFSPNIIAKNQNSIC